jgi:hypothetical protein
VLKSGRNSNKAARVCGLGMENAPDGFFPSGASFEGYMRILVQDRETRSFLTEDARWVTQHDRARSFTTSLEALRFCVQREMKNMDLVVCYPGPRSNLRLPLC